MKKIGVLSDTHVPVNVKKLPSLIFEAFKDVDLILHAGDLVEKTVIDELSAIAPLKIVSGNMDSFEIRQKYPEKTIIEVEKKKIGLIHGKGSASGLTNYIKAELRKVDVIVYGHSHIPENKVIDGVLFFNPGSLTDKIFATSNSYGFLYVDENGVKGEIVRI